MGTDESLTRRYDPDELRRHLSERQCEQIVQAIEIIQAQSGHGEVRIILKNGHARFIGAEFTFAEPTINPNDEVPAFLASRKDTK
jgi:hypothetical protein